MNRRINCFVGWRREIYQLAFDDDKSSYYYHRYFGNDHIVIIFKQNDNSITCLQFKDVMNVVNKNEVEKGVTIQLNDDGSRWEGDWYNQQPFGFGSLFDGEGNKIYNGFMFEGKKVIFGTEYFADNHKVDYCGNFVNDKRHGWGCTYDRNGNKLYEGDWRFGKNDFEDRIVFENEEDGLKVHDLIKELEIGEGCLNEWKDDLEIENFPNLQSIIVKKGSLRNLNSLKIWNCEKLETIEIEDGTCKNVKNVIIESI